MKFAPSLFTRGLIVIVVPVLCPLLFLVHLHNVRTLDIQPKLDRASNSYELVRLAYKCFRETGEEVVRTGLSVRLGQEESTRSGVLAKFEYFQKNIDRLADSIESDPNQKKNAADLRKSSQKLFDILYSALPESDLKRWSQRFDRPIRHDVEAYMPIFLEVISRIVEVEEKQNAADVEAAEKAFQGLVLVMAIAVVVPIVVALMIGVYFSISITRPLKHLSNNGRLLSKRAPLPPVMNDAVEFTRVDQLLHTASSAVEGALTRERDVIENALDLICTLDRDQMFRSANPYVERMLGYPPTALIGKHFSDLADDYEWIAATNVMQSTVESGTMATFELRMRRMNETTIDTKWSCVWSPVHEMFFCVVSDVTEQRRAEQLKLDFSDAISDDLRSPLVSIQSSLNALLQGAQGELTPEIASSLMKTAKSVDRLVLLANELLDFQKIKGGKMQIDSAVHSLNQIAEEAGDCVSVLAEAKKITLQLPKNKVAISCDRMKMLQTIVNLLSNAIKFSPLNSTVEISIAEEGAFVSLSVIDSGPGIPPEYQQRIFEPFEQVPGAQAKVGTGLGLAICKLIAEAHGGSISVTSLSANESEKTGSTFTFKLPKKP